MEKKTIQIDPINLQMSQNKHGNKSNKKREKSKSQIAKVKPQSVKEILLQKLKEYKKQKQKQSKKTLQHKNNDQIISDSFLNTIQKKKNKTEQNIYLDELKEPSSPTHIEESNINNIKKNEDVIIEKAPSSFQILPVPKYSNLKNSNLPTYRQLKNKTTKVNKPQTFRVNLSKTMKVGKNKKNNQIGIFLKNKTMKQNIELNIIEMKKTKPKTIKSYLKKKNLIQYGTNAPTDLLREIYISSEMCGGIENKNGTNLVENFYEKE